MGPFKNMVSMELSDDQKLDSPMPIAMPTKPDYPWGLRITLTDQEFAKLGLDPADASVGEVFHFFALARVTCISVNDGPDGKCCRLEAQIEDLAVESEDEENEEHKER